MGFTFAKENPRVWVVLLAQALAGYGGLRCYLSIVRASGGVMGVVTTTARKGVTLLLSYLTFTKPFGAPHAAGMALLVGGLTSTVWIKSKKARAQRRRNECFPQPSPGHGAIGAQRSPWRGSVSSPRPPPSPRSSSSSTPSNSLASLSADEGTSERAKQRRGGDHRDVERGGLTFAQIAMALNGDAPTLAAPAGAHGRVPDSPPRRLATLLSPGATRNRKLRTSSPLPRTGSHLSREASPINSREHSREGSVSPRGELFEQHRRVSIEDSSWPPR